MTTNAPEEIQAVDPSTLANPDKMREGDYIQTAGEDFSKVTQVRHKDDIRVWDTKTGQPGYTTHHFRHVTARREHPDGSRMFTFVDPQIPQVIGQELPCPLNPASKDHSLVEGMGFTPCRKLRMPNQAAVDAHVAKSHKRAKVAIDEVKAARLHQETIDSNRSLVEALIGQIKEQQGSQSEWKSGKNT